MVTGDAVVRDVGRLDGAGLLVRRLESEWQRGDGDLHRLWEQAGDGRTDSALAGMVKVDLRCRFERGERPAVAQYLDRYPRLRQGGDRVLSLIYEEYCLLEERGARPDTAEFCDRYGPWKDSLVSQLGYHRMISKVAGAAAPVPEFPKPGQNFLHFRIRGELGRGGAARVYLASDDSLGGREVALKVTPDRGSEAAILGRLEHPHIVAVHSVVREDLTRLRGICMPYRPGRPLNEVLERLRPVSGRREALEFWRALVRPPLAAGTPPHDPSSRSAPSGPGWASFPARGRYDEGAAWVVATLAGALAYAHSQGVKHRDVKPANVLLTYRDGPQLLDFNLAHDAHDAAQADAALRGGTLPYMAPEQLLAFLDPDRWDDVGKPADIYSLGLVLCELLTGRAPEPPEAGPPLPRAIRGLAESRRDFRPDLSRPGDRVPRALKAVAAKCLAFDPDDRYTGASELAEDLRLFLARRPLRHAARGPVRERAGDWTWRNRATLLWAATALGAASAAGLGVSTLVRRPAPEKAAASAVRGPLPDGKTAALRLYQIASLRGGDNSGAADAALREVWDRPDAATEFIEWGRADPDFASALTQVATASLDYPPESPDRRALDERLRRCERTFQVALQIEPRLAAASQGIAVVLEKRGRREDAIKILDRLIGQGPGVCQSKESCQYVQTRARMRTALATEIVQGTTDPAAFVRAETLLDAAREDLRIERPMMADPPAEWRVLEATPGDNLFRVDLIGCQIQTTSADITDRKGDHARALVSYHEVSRRLEALRPIGINYLYFRQFETAIKTKIAHLAPTPGTPAAGNDD